MATLKNDLFLRAFTDARLPHTGSGRAAGGERPIPLSPTAYALAADPEGRDTTLAAAMAASGR